MLTDTTPRSYARNPGRECPYCECEPVDRAAHIASFHKERLRAQMAYQRVIAEGGTAEQARAAYNESLRPGKRIGGYDRAAFRKAS